MDDATNRHKSEGPVKKFIIALGLLALLAGAIAIVSGVGRTERPDLSPPVTHARFPEGWNSTPVVVYLITEDPYATTYSRVDGGARQTGRRVSIQGTGIHRLVYWSIDAYGNREQKSRDVVRIDMSGPRTSVPRSSRT